MVLPDPAVGFNCARMVHPELGPVLISMVGEVGVVGWGLYVCVCVCVCAGGIAAGRRSATWFGPKAVESSAMPLPAPLLAPRLM